MRSRMTRSAHDFESVLLDRNDSQCAPILGSLHMMLRQPLYLCAMLTPALVALAAAGQVHVALSPTTDLRPGRAVDVEVRLSGLPDGTRLSFLGATVRFDAGLLGTPHSISRGGIVPSPLASESDLLTLRQAGLADASFYTTSILPHQLISQNGVFITFRVTPSAPGAGTIRIDFAEAMAFDPADPETPDPLHTTNSGVLPINVRYLNETCAETVEIGDGATPFINTFADTDGPPEPSAFPGSDPQIGGDLWYTYTPSLTGTVSINTCDAGFDTRLAVYDSACSTAPGQLIASDDDGCGEPGGGSRVFFRGESGVYYLIRIGGAGAARGSGTLIVRGCPADFNRDGGVDGADIEAFFASWEFGSFDADINEDGGIDGTDVGEFMDIWENVRC